MLRSWSRCLSRKQPATPGGRRHCLRLEEFEARCLLATWTAIGPAPQFTGQADGGGNYTEAVTGRVTALAISTNPAGLPAGQDTLYLGAAGGGVWRSTNFAGNDPTQVTWLPPTADATGLPVDPATGLGAGALNIGTIAVDPNHQQTVYAGTGNADQTPTSAYGTGIVKSTDGGAHWRLLATGSADAPQAFFRHSISKIVVDPTDLTGNTLYAAVVPPKGGTPPADPVDLALGIYRSGDGGLNWNKITSRDNPPGDNIVVSDLDYTVNQGHLVLFAGIGYTDGGGDARDGVWRGVSQPDGSIQWNRLENGIISGVQAGRVLLAADHHPGSQIVYAAISHNPEGHPYNVFRTDTNGDQWDDVTPRNVVIYGGASSMACALHVIFATFFLLIGRGIRLLVNMR